jgi:hypothetical protein
MNASISYMVRIVHTFLTLLSVFFFFFKSGLDVAWSSFSIPGEFFQSLNSLGFQGRILTGWREFFFCLFFGSLNTFQYTNILIHIYISVHIHNLDLSAVCIRCVCLSEGLRGCGWVVVVSDCIFISSFPISTFTSLWTLQVKTIW